MRSVPHTYLLKLSGLHILQYLLVLSLVLGCDNVRPSVMGDVGVMGDVV